MTDTKGATAVVHIALRAYGIAPFRAFLESYHAHPAGRDHDLIVVVKGFSDDAEAAPFVAELGSLSCTIVYQPDGGFDIGSYYAVMRTHDRATFCLFNSRSRILGDDWLAKLCAPLEAPDVGVAGATGSFESLLTDHLLSFRREQPSAGGMRARLRRAIRLSPLNHLRHWWRYAPFPNPHLRTNAIAIRRSVALAHPPRPTHSRKRTAAFENGRNNLSRRLARVGLRSVVVGRDGNPFDPAAWPTSGTFWQGEQENLLVADNQTDLYARAATSERAFLRLKAWGAPLHDRADPGH